MAGNRRGFIGIFSQLGNDSDDDDASELEDRDAQVAAPASKPIPAESADSADSDWDDVFDEGNHWQFLTSDGRGRGDTEHRSVMPKTPAAPATANSTSSSKPALSHEPPAAPATPSSGAVEIATPGHGPPTDRQKASVSRSDNSFTNQADVSPSTHPSNPRMNDQPSSTSALSSSDRQAIQDAIQTLREKLSFARSSPADQRASLMHLGATGQRFVDQALKTVNETPDVLPRSFDDGRFSDDVDLAKTLRSIVADLEELTQRVSDTEAKISGSTFLGAMVVQSSSRTEPEPAVFEAYRSGSLAAPTARPGKGSGGFPPVVTAANGTMDRAKAGAGASGGGF